MPNTAQPGTGRFQEDQEWSNGLLDCCSDCKTLLCACFCFPCFMCDLFKDAEECPLTGFCCPGSDLILRGKIRGHYHIKGEIWKDFCVMSFCRICALIQMKNELVAHGVD